MDFGSGISVVLLIVSAAAAVSALIIKPRDRWAAARAIIYITAYFIMLKPSVSLEEKRISKKKVGVFLDASLSMSVENRPEDAIRAAESIIRRLEPDADVRIYKFGSALESVKRPELKSVHPEYDATDLSCVIKEPGLDARIIVTDGRDNTGVNPLVLNELKWGPVFPVGVGGKEEVPDIGISDLKVPGFGFREQEIKVQFDVFNTTLSPGRTRVYLKEGDTVMSRAEINLGSKERVPVEMVFTPMKIGLKNYVISADKIPGEVNLANNTRNFQVQVNRQNVRILYVAGQPSWEYSFFRRLVKSDPKTDLVSFLILRNPENVTIVNEYELSLIHFPAREMFTEKIYEFDLLIYDNFSYSKFFPKSYLTHIKNFVMKGGAFVMLGGEDSFGRGGYIGTAIEDILPVYMKQDSEWKLGRIPAKVTKSINHPVLNLANDTRISLGVWGAMPALEGYDDGLKARPGATVLLENDAGVPILAVQDAGEGRVMAFNSNTTWRWCLGLAGQGKTPFYYNLFWQRLIRFMIQSEELKNVQVFPGREIVNKGDDINVNIKVVDRYWQPSGTADVLVDIKTPSGGRVPMGRAEVSGEDGWYNLSFTVNETGVYRINAKAYLEDSLLGESAAEFAGISADREFLNTSVNDKLLAELARISGGVYYTSGNVDAGEISEIIRKRDAGSRSPARKISWHAWPVYLFLITVMLAEWYFRRRRGLS
ncbi:MAG: hypothetical protein JXJ19_01215 [Elusimicrobia bacterium]|nr:hypothetical protein [Elusimicrobiota bacterium]